MKIYHYNRNGVYKGESEAKVDKRETEKSEDKETVYRIPAHATTVKPPSEKKGKVRVFDKETEVWSQVDDKTGLEFYDLETGRKIVATSFDFDETGYTNKKPQGVEFESWDADAEEWAVDLTKYLSSYRDQFVYAGIEVNDITIPTDDLTVSRITGARIKADLDPDFTFKWKVSGSFVDLTAEQIIAISDAIFNHIQNCFTAESGVSLDGLTTIQEVEEAFDTALSDVLGA